MDFFTVEFDTTGPGINISAPSYTGRHTWIEITVKGTEKLDTKHVFYFIDSRGEKHPVIFSHEGDRFIGEVRFINFAVGIAVFYAQIWDDVGNPSPIVQHAIEVLSDLGRQVKTQIGTSQRPTNILLQRRPSLLRGYNRRPDMQVNHRIIDVKTKVKDIRLWLGGRE